MDDIFGTIEAPQGVTDYNTGDTIGIVLFFSRILRLITIVGGVLLLVNIIWAGIEMITAGGKSDAYSKGVNRIVMSVVGILVIVASYMIAGLVGQIFFGDPGYILKPTICGPSGC